MTDRTNPVQYWTRELGHLRGRVLRFRGRTAEPDDGDLTEAALAAADSLLRELAGAQLECERLRAASRAQTAEWERLFDAMPCAWVITDRAGSIRDANGMAGVLLNLSVRHLRGPPAPGAHREPEGIQRSSGSAEQRRRSRRGGL